MPNCYGIKKLLVIKKLRNSDQIFKLRFFRNSSSLALAFNGKFYLFSKVMFIL